MGVDMLAFLMVVAIIAAFVGWILNIHKIMEAPIVTGMTLLRVVGIILFPIGCILGFMKDKY